MTAAYQDSDMMAFAVIYLSLSLFGCQVSGQTANTDISMGEPTGNSLTSQIRQSSHSIPHSSTPGHYLAQTSRFTQGNRDLNYQTPGDYHSDVEYGVPGDSAAIIHASTAHGSRVLYASSVVDFISQAEQTRAVTLEGEILQSLDRSDFGLRKTFASVSVFETTDISELGGVSDVAGHGSPIIGKTFEITPSSQITIADAISIKRDHTFEQTSDAVYPTRTYSSDSTPATYMESSHANIFIGVTDKTGEGLTPPLPTSTSVLIDISSRGAEYLSSETHAVSEATFDLGTYSTYTSAPVENVSEILTQVGDVQSSSARSQLVLSSDVYKQTYGREEATSLSPPETTGIADSGLRTIAATTTLELLSSSWFGGRPISQSHTVSSLSFSQEDVIESVLLQTISGHSDDQTLSSSQHTLPTVSEGLYFNVQAEGQTSLSSSVSVHLDSVPSSVTSTDIVFLTEVSTSHSNVTVSPTEQSPALFTSHNSGSQMTTQIKLSTRVYFPSSYEHSILSEMSTLDQETSKVVSEILTESGGVTSDYSSSLDSETATVIASTYEEQTGEMALSTSREITLALPASTEQMISEQTSTSGEITLAVLPSMSQTTVQIGTSSVMVSPFVSSAGVTEKMVTSSVYVSPTQVYQASSSMESTRVVQASSSTESTPVDQGSSSTESTPVDQASSSTESTQVDQASSSTESSMMMTSVYISTVKTSKTSTVPSTWRPATDKERQVKDCRFLLTFSGDCHTILNNTKLLGEFVASLRDVLIKNLEVKEEQINLHDISCGSLKIYVTLKHVPYPQVAQILERLVSQNSFSVPILIEGRLISYLAINVKEVKILPMVIDPIDLPDEGLDKVDIIVIIVACCVCGILITIGIALCVKECYRRKYAQSFDLLDVPHVNLKLEDFTLTRIPRPKTSYNDENVTMQSYSDGYGQHIAKNNGHHAANGNGVNPNDVHVRMRQNTDGLVVGVTGYSSLRSGQSSSKSSYRHNSVSSEVSQHGDNVNHSVENLVHSSDIHATNGAMNPIFVDDECGSSSGEGQRK